MANKDKNQDWKWGQSSQNAFKSIGQFLNIDPKGIAQVNNAQAKSVLKLADNSDVQVKRTQDVTNAYKKLWRNQSKIGAMIHGLVRTGMQHVIGQRRQEAATTKEYAKLVTDTSVLSAKTRTAVEKTHHKGAKQIQQATTQLELAKGEIDEQYQTIETTAQQQSQQRRVGYRDRAQKRLASSQRPWRN